MSFRLFANISATHAGQMSLKFAIGHLYEIFIISPSINSHRYFIIQPMHTIYELYAC